MTDYIVMRRNGAAELKQLGVHRCNGPEVAIREIAKNEPGIYVAVAVRNWHEVDGAPQVVERFVLKEKEAPEAHPGQTTVDEALAEEPTEIIVGAAE